MDAVEFGYDFYHPDDRQCDLEDCGDCDDIDCKYNRFYNGMEWKHEIQWRLIE